MRRRGARGKRNVSEKVCTFCDRNGHIERDCWARAKAVKQLKQPKSAQINNQETALAYTPRDRQRSDFTTFAARESVRQVSSSNWIIDSGCTGHMTNDRSFFDDFLEETNRKVYLAGRGTWVPATGIGSGTWHCLLPDGGICEVKLTDVLYVPELTGGLISVARAVEKGASGEFF